VKITKSQLKRIIKEELQAVLTEVDGTDEPAWVSRGAEQAKAIAQLANDKVLYYGAKGAVDDLDYDQREMSDEEFVQLLQQTLEDIKFQGTDRDTVETETIKEIIFDWLLHEKASGSEIYRAMEEKNPGSVDVYAIMGMIEWGKKQVELGTYEERLARWDAGER
jgi:hypothetical protein